MEKEKVEILAKNLMERLHLKKRDLDDIMRCYSSEEHITSRLKNEKKDGEQERDEMPESAQMVYFPWVDVIGSMMAHPEFVHYVETVCPDCGEKLLQLNFTSPKWTWRALCGRSGPMCICPNCPRQDSFSLWRMN